LKENPNIEYRNPKWLSILIWISVFDLPANIFRTLRLLGALWIQKTAKNSKKTHNGAKIALLNSETNVQASVATEGESSTAA
jgi:hypothetical protein